jgi:tryptophanyl-tRNA synthetase
MSDQKSRVLSGIQPSGNLTIGNYLGAIKQWVDRQDSLDAFYCVVDMHAITVPHNPEELHQKTREVAALYIASGLDPQQNTLFVQSHVTAHAELSWLLTCITSLGWLYRMTQFKDKSQKFGEEDAILAGLLNYPVLMAADILLYQAQKVPVGEDQRQHIELTRDIAQRFNHQFGETFTVPEAMIPPQGAKIMGLDTPTAKMSKSNTDSQYHAVFMLDDPKTITKKIKRAVTDSGSDILFSDDPEKAGVNNLLTIYQAFTDKSKEQVEADFSGKRYGDLKTTVAEVVVESLAPLQQRYHDLMNESGYIDEVLANGAAKAREVADHTLRLAKERMGFVLPR